MIPKVIGVCGLRRAGKDTVARYFVDHLGYEHCKISDELKKIVQLLFHFTDQQLETDEKDRIDPRWNITPRCAMQFIGTEIMQYKIQEILPDTGRKFWISSFIQRHLVNDKKIVISDLRFLHEYEELQKATQNQLLVIRVERNNCMESAHISEKEYKTIPADIVVTNDGSIDELYTQLVKLNNTLPV